MKKSGTFNPNRIIVKSIALAVAVTFIGQTYLCLADETNHPTYTKAAKAGAWPVPRKITYGHHVVYGAAPAQGEESALRPVRRPETRSYGMKEPPANNIGEDIRKLRMALALNLAGFGRELALSREACRRWENGTHLPSAENFTKIKTYAGAQIRLMRKLLELNQSRLGRKLGVHPRTVSSWETGGLLPPAEAVEEIMKLARPKLEELIKQLCLDNKKFGRRLRPPVSRKMIYEWKSGRRKIPMRVFRQSIEMLATRLKEIREEAGLSLEEFGRLLNPNKPIPAPTLHYWENNGLAMPKDAISMAIESVKKKAKQEGAELRQVRRTLGLSAKELTGQLALDVSPKTVYAWENGYCLPRRDILPKAKALAGGILRQWREGMGFTRKELIERLNGRTSMSIDTLRNCETKGQSPEKSLELLRLIRGDAHLRFAQLQVECGLKTEDLAAWLGISRYTIYAWKKGEYPVPLRAIQRTMALIDSAVSVSVRPDGAGPAAYCN